MIALVAHDGMKKLMGTFVECHKTLLAEFRLTGTETTCRLLRALGLVPEDLLVPSGPLGGDQVLGGLVTTGQIKALSPPLNNSLGAGVTQLIRSSLLSEIL